MTQSIFTLPAPEGNPLVGNLLDIGQDPLGFITKCRDYGDIVPLRLGLKSGCLVMNPNYIEDILKQRDVFRKDHGVGVLKTLLGQGLLTAEGDSWLSHRRLIQPIFQQKRIEAYAQIMVNYTERMVQSWHNVDTLDIHAQMMRLTLDIVMKCIFDTNVEDREASVISNALEVIMHWHDSKRRQGFLVWEWFPRPENIRYHQAIAEIDSVIYTLIRARRNSSETTHDLLSMLMEARDEETSQQMDDKQLRDEVVTLMLAGHETTANTLAWTWMLLSQHPHVREKLQAELGEVLQGKLPTRKDLSELQYTQQIVKESMRLYPPVSIFGREVAQDTTIGDYEMSQGTVLLISQWVMHRHPKYFDNPEGFQPERWTAEFEKQLPACVYIPFGDGPRICIGKGFAQMEAALILATIAQKVEMNLVSGFSIVPQPSITLRPEHGIKVQLKQFDVMSK